MNKHIPSLNGLRAISILMVIAYHFDAHHYFNRGLMSIGFLLFNGQLGVNIFFVISGFLITRLLIAEKEKNGYISFKNFYIRRTIRIFPAYYFFLLTLFIFQCLGFVQYGIVDWLINITYTRQFFIGTHFQTGHLWSLSVEEFFYLIWPFVFVKSGINNTKIILFTVFLLVVGRFFSYSYPVPRFSNSGLSSGDALLIGCLFAIKYEEIVVFVTRFKKFYIIPFILLALCSFTRAYFFHLITSVKMGPGESFWISNILSPLSYSLLGNIGLLTNISIAIIMVYVINIKSVFSSFLNLPFMEYIGKLSYSIYLWQQIFTQDNDFCHKIPIYF